MTFEENILPLCEFLENEIKDELISQDHIATGKLRDSIKVSVRKTAYGYVIEGKGLLYGRYVDSGRRVGIKRVPTDALLGWLRAKNIDLKGRREIDVAYLIQNAIYKKGIPTNKSEKLKGFINRTVEKHSDKTKTDNENAIVQFNSIELHNIVWNTQQLMNKT